MTQRATYPQAWTKRCLSLVFLIASSIFVVACEDSDKLARRYIQESQEHIANENFESAAIALKNALQQVPEHVEARLLLGRTYRNMGDFHGAEKEIVMAGRLGARPEVVAIDLAETLNNLGRFDRAITELDSKPQEKTAWFVAKGVAHLGLEQSELAEKAFTRALALDPISVEAQRGLAHVELQKGDERAAVAVVEKALENSNTDAETWLLKGELEMSLKRYAQARDSFSNVPQTHAKHFLASIGVARALIGEKDVAGAKSLVTSLRSEVEDDVRLLYLSALINRDEGDFVSAQSNLRAVLSLVPNHIPSLFLLAQMNFGKKQFAQAERQIAKLLAQRPSHLEGTKMLGAIQLMTNRQTEAIETLKPLVARAPRDTRLLELLGNAYLVSGQVKLGHELLLEANELEPNHERNKTQLAMSRMAAGEVTQAIEDLESIIADNPDAGGADTLLVMGYLRARNLDNALDAATRLADKQPDSAPAQNLLGVVREARNETKLAIAQYHASVDKDPSFLPGMLNLARVHLKRGESDIALRHYQDILQVEPNHPVALLALARFALEQDDTDNVLALLEQARANNEQALKPRLVLGNFRLRRGQLDEALRVATEAKRIAPTNANMLLLLANIHVKRGKPNDAVDVLGELIKIQPKSIVARFALVNAHTKLNSPLSAKNILNEILEIDPKNVQALFALGGLAVQDRDIELARKFEARIAQIAPNAPHLAMIRGSILMREEKPGEAVTEYKKALEQEPNEQVALQTANAIARAHGQPAMVEFMSGWLAKQPKWNSIRLALATLEHATAEGSDLIERYETILEDEPNNVVAINNLAWVYHQQSDPRALATAKRAFGIAPGRPEIADTYGWLLVLNGQAERGLAILAKALESRPENPDIKYHFAAALARAGEENEAIAKLESLLALPDTFAERNSAITLLNTLKTER